MRGVLINNICYCKSLDSGVFLSDKSMNRMFSSGQIQNEQKIKPQYTSNMKLKRGFVTPVLTLIFLVVALSGVLMFFHLLDGYTTTIHEFLGLTFVLFSILHLVINWRSLKSYFRKKTFLISTAVVLVLSIFLIVVDNNHKDHNEILIEKLVTAPIAEICVVLGTDISHVEMILGSNNQIVGEQETIKSLAERNSLTPQKLLARIIEDQQ